MSEMIGAGVPASPVLEEEEGVGGSLIDGGSLLMEEGKSPVPVAADYLTQKVISLLSLLFCFLTSFTCFSFHFKK